MSVSSQRVSQTQIPAGRSAHGHAAARVASIDMLRAGAALAVVAFHAQYLGDHAGNPALGHADFLVATSALLGQGGVVLFFSISGLLIAGPYLRAIITGAELPETLPYSIRRSARILPAYWIALVAAILVSGHGQNVPGLRDLGIHAALLQDYVPFQAEAYLVVAWTLGLEAAFYVLVPLAAHAVRLRWKGPIAADRIALAVIGLWVASALFGEVAYQVLAFGQPWTVPVRFSPPAMLGLFCPGMLVAIATAPHALGSRTARAFRAVTRRSAVPLLLAGTALAVATLRSVTHHALAGPVAYQELAVAAGLLVAVAAATSAERHPRWTRPIAFLGVVSYGIYLWHTIVLAFVQERGWVPHAGGFPVDVIAYTVILVALTIPVAAISWFLVERPAIDLGTRFVAALRSERWSREVRRNRPVLVMIGAVSCLIATFSVVDADRSALGRPPLVAGGAAASNQGFDLPQALPAAATPRCGAADMVLTAAIDPRAGATRRVILVLRNASAQACSLPVGTRVTVTDAGGSPATGICAAVCARGGTLGAGASLTTTVPLPPAGPVTVQWGPSAAQAVPPVAATPSP